MDPKLLIAILGVLVFIGIFGAGYVILGSSSLEKRFRHKSAQPAESPSRWFAYLRKSEDVLKPLGGMIPRSPEEMSRQEQRLVRAGIRRKDGPLLLYGAKVALAIVLSVGLITVHLNFILAILIALFFGALIPDLWLEHRIRRRKDLIQAGLPSALDLAVVCVEAGLGLDQSLMRIGQELRKGYPDLSEELYLLSLEVNAGRKRTDALRNMGNRSDSKDLKALTAVLIQTDRFGTSIAQSLRTFSDSMRSTRRLRAEEHAAKMSIKMLPPLVFFIFPALFIVILGPAVISVMRNLLPALGGK